MTHHDRTAPPPAGAAPWTIARVQQALTNEVMVRHFLRDLTHAPAPRIMEVFTSWQHVAATIEANTTKPPTAVGGGLRGTAQDRLPERSGGGDADQQ